MCVCEMLQNLIFSWQIGRTLVMGGLPPRIGSSRAWYATGFEGIHHN